MIESVIMTLVAGSTAHISEILITAFKEYLKKKGEKISEKPTEDELSRSLASLEKRESSTAAITATQNVFGNAISQLGTFRVERERQARNSYNLACTVLAAGSALVLGGIAWMWFGHSVLPGTITSGVGAITSLCSGAIFKFSKEANDRLDDIAANLHKIEATSVALDVVQRITNESERNAAINQLAIDIAGIGKGIPGRNNTASKRPR